ncbi:MAG: phosphopantothenoylcysteine decarboxylase [Candidatus Omnitrophota bacterium]
MVTSLKDKKVLITAGPTWVKIDSVRVISNNATGSTGILLAEKLTQLGAKVTLLLGSVGADNLNKKIRVLHFQYFDELKALLEKELKTRKYDLAIHSAAVSDYKPKLTQKGKIKSGLEELNIKLTPTLKIIDIFKKLQPSISLVGFKFEPEASKFKLINEARGLIHKTKADFVISNTLKRGRYLAYLVTENVEGAPVFSKKDMVENLLKSIRKN